MNISYNWLRQYLDLNLSPEELSIVLTNCGLEVESLEQWSSAKNNLDGLVIGHVLECSKIEGTDHLSKTKVDVGNGIVLPVVCGAPNVAAGQNVIVATVGTKLTMKGQTIEIKKAKLRGESSEGMICAEDEIGLGDSHAGIMVLPESAVAGTPLKDYLQIETDFIFSIGLTPNRTDAMSHIGVARDIKAAINAAGFHDNNRKELSLKLPATDHFSPDNNELDIEVIVEDKRACPRYTGVSISGVKVRESPLWLRNRLLAIGLRPINNIVDITNYVLHESGQPLHAFDAGRIAGGKVIVKKLPASSKFTTLDNAEVELTGDDLIICNAEEGMCIGGVLGGLKSGVTEQTRDIFLESACFNPVTIRKTSKAHAIQTDASFRFERGVDPASTLFALKRAALLIKEIAGGKISSGIKDICEIPGQTKVELQWNYLNTLIGKELPRDLVRYILEQLDFIIEDEDKNSLYLSVPFYRVDVTRAADVVEEILRIYGYNQVEIPTHVRSASVSFPKPDFERLRENISGYFTSLGFNEIMNNSLTKAAYYETDESGRDAELVRILNPLSKDLNVMRKNLLFGGLETIQFNLNRKISNQKVFEFGRVYTLKGSNNTVSAGNYSEIPHLSVLVTGNIAPETWYQPVKAVDFHYLKAICENILAKAGLSGVNIQIRDIETKAGAGLVYTFNQQTLLTIIKVSKALLKYFDIGQEVYYADYYFENLEKAAGDISILYTEIPKFPEVRRDLALLVDKSVRFREIEELAYSTETRLLKQVNLFDTYEGAGIDSHKKSYAVSFVLQDDQKTLTDDIIEKVMKRLLSAFESKLNAQLR